MDWCAALGSEPVLFRMQSFLGTLLPEDSEVTF